MAASKRSKANYGSLFNAGAALKPGAFPTPLATTYDESDEEVSAQMLPLEVLLDNPYQPRSSVNEASLDQLAQIIKEQGFQGVLVARPHPDDSQKYQLTAGHRRRNAARKAGLTTLPVVVKTISDEDMAILAVTENIQREDLTPLEEGKIFCLMMEQMGMTLEQVANAVKKSESYIRNRRRVAMAPEDIQLMVMQKPDSLRAVFYLLKIEDVSIRASIIELILQGQLTADQVDEYVKSLEQKKLETSAVLSSPEVPTHQDNGPQPISVTSEQATNTPGSVSEYHEGGPLVTVQVAVEHVISEKRRIVGVSKLKSLLKTIRAYAQAITPDETPTNEELEIVNQIIEVAQQIKQGA